MSTAVVAIADKHTNSTVGLCMPVVRLDDGGEYKATRLQKSLWGSWLELCQEVKQWGQGHYKILIDDGDIIDVDQKRRSKQLITRNKAVITDMAADVLAPMLAEVNDAIFIRGTPAHAGQSAEYEEEVAGDCLIHIKDPETKAACWQQFRQSIEAVRFDVAHYCSMGGNPRTERNAANVLAHDVIVDYARLEMALPHIVIRAHQHRWSDSDDLFPTRAITLPGWCFQTEYINNKGHQNKLSEIGALGIICENGTMKITKWKFRPQRRLYMGWKELPKRISGQK